MHPKINKYIYKIKKKKKRNGWEKHELALGLMIHLPKQITPPHLPSDVQESTTLPCVWKKQVFLSNDCLMMTTTAQAQSLGVINEQMLITQGSGIEFQIGLVSATRQNGGLK